MELKYLNLKSKLNRGVYVSKVISNGPAAGSDLKEGDLICSVNGKNLNTINDLREFVYGKVPGVEVELEVIRGESRKNIKIALGRKN